MHGPMNIKFGTGSSYKILDVVTMLQSDSRALEGHHFHCNILTALKSTNCILNNADIFMEISSH
jgi:HJR/Mrr/RecB family endonuclease